MARRTLLPLLAALTALAVGPASAQADRPLSDLTCEPGEPAVDDRGHTFYDHALVLGCVPLAGGTRLQVDVSPHRRGLTCLYFTFDRGIYGCPASLGERAKPLLILSHRSPRPRMVLGTAPATADHVLVSYETRSGAHRSAPSRLIEAPQALAERVGVPGGFSIFVSELGPGADVCAGVRALAQRRQREPEPALEVFPDGVMSQPDGWLLGFAPSWGIGVGPTVPRVCGSTEGEERSDRSLAQIVGLVVDMLWVSGLTPGAQ